MQPRNTTVKYGEIAQFECQIHMEHGQDIHLFFGSSIVYPTMVERFSTLDQREFSVNVSQCTDCLHNQTVAARVWILVNSKTLPIIEPFLCRVFHNLTYEDSTHASIQVLYSECAILPLLSNNMFPVTSTHLLPRELPITSTTFLETVTILSRRPCSTGELNISGMQKKTKLHAHFRIILSCKLCDITVLMLNFCIIGNVRSNKLAISLCASLAVVMLGLLTVTYVCICIQHRKQLTCGKIHDQHKYSLYTCSYTCISVFFLFII